MSDKILKLSQAQTLYQDLRGRIDALPTDSDIPEVPVTDVQINGTSILSSGVANVPKASASNLGVVKVDSSTSAVNINSSGVIGLETTTANVHKAGTSTTRAVIINNQHSATFYGLAKCAGDSSQSSSSNAVGVYTDTAKQKIQNMLGITNLISTEESSTATAAHAINSTFMMDGKLHRATTAIAIGDAVVVGTNCEVVKADEVFVKNTDYATQTNAGVVKVNTYGAYGVRISSEVAGDLRILKADSTDIKTGTQQYRPIMPYSQHEAVFYGLSKLAGVNLASETVTVGTYPNTSKIAIRKMISALGVNNIYDGLSTYMDAETGDWVLTANVQDVQINGTSIISNGVANIPVATANTFGVIKVNDGTNGLRMDSGYLKINYATSAYIKTGSDAGGPLVPYLQHEAVFYGLTKAAGVDMASSSNAVGTYTDSAKIAIKNMLGVTQTLTVTVLTQDNVTVTNQTVTLREGGPTGQVHATATYSGQPVSFALPTGFSYYVSVSDTLAHHFNPTTASGIITDADAAATLTYSDFSSIQTAADIKAALNAGLDLTDLVGEQISCTWNNSTLVWDVVDYSNDTITLLTHDTLPTQLVFEPVQALMWCENGLAAGSYSFIDDSSTYYFTLTTAIPSGGQLRATTSTFQTYASMEATATLKTGTVSTTEISGATSLGTTASGNLNHMSRVNYGSNNYKESALFQWLNSTEAANIPMPRITKFSRPCTYSVPGFLGALDGSFVAAIDDTTWLCSTNNTYECPTSLGGTVAKSNAYTVTAKVGLASEMEIFGSYGGTADGSAVFDLFNGATAGDRKKYQPGTSTARHWWLRSPSWGYASHERYVNSSGTAGNYNAYYSRGVVPAVKISKTVVSE